LVSDIHPYPNATLVKYDKTGSGYRSTSGPSFLKTYLSIACNMTLIHDKCAVGWTTLGRNLVSLNQTLIKPKPHVWPQKFGNFWKKKIKAVPWKIKTGTISRPTMNLVQREFPLCEWLSFGLSAL